MWPKYYLARPVAHYPACVYLLPSPDETSLGRTADSKKPGARAEQRMRTGQSQGGLISFARGGTVHSNDLTERCDTLGGV